MRDALNKEEIEQLRPFRFTTEERLNDLSIPINELFDDHAMLEYMEKVGAHIGSPNVRVTASIFVKRYAFLVVIYLYGITAWNKKLNTLFQNISFQTEEADQEWIPKFYFHNTTVEIAGDDRDDWRAKAVRDFFSNHVQSLIVQLSRVTKQSKLVLWEDISIYIFWLYESIFQQSEDEELRSRAKEDFFYLVHEAPGSVFWNNHENPIKGFYNTKRYVEHIQGEVRVRTTCCLSYLLDGSPKRCKTCPQKIQDVKQ